MDLKKYIGIYDKVFPLKTLSIFLKYINTLDFEDESVLTNGKEKIIYLNELKILEYLRKEYPILRTSNNKLAALISKITGQKHSTIQSYINPILNSEGRVDQSNNPYNNKKNVSKVKAFLSSEIEINPIE